MNEFEILQNAQNSFQQNAAYLLVVTILVCLNFYLIRRARELNMPVYGKVMTTIFGLMTINFGWTVGTFLRGTQNDMAFRLSELKSRGTEIFWPLAKVGLNLWETQQVLLWLLHQIYPLCYFGDY